MFYLGFDIGGTKCAASVGEVSYGDICIVERKEVLTTTKPLETMGLLDKYVQEYLEKYSIKSVGISCGGPLDSKEGIILCPPNLPGWENFPIAEYVKNTYGLQARLENDANACAIAEWKFGAGKGRSNIVFLTFGTGLGAGLILDGKLYSGTNGNAGEVGHIRLAKKGPIGFGKVGSFEGFCSGGGITRLAEIMGKRRKETPQCIVNMGGYEKITTKELAQAAFAGDKFAKQVFAKSGKMLGKGLSMLIDILNPERIVLGGVFMRSATLLVSSMQKEIQKEALLDSTKVCEIVPAQLKENIGDIAAVSVALVDN
jgi:glucokinase